MTKEKSTLGNLIRLVRQQRNWTLREMSAKVGIPLSTLAKVEADKLSLTYDKLQQFTSRLGMTLTEFLGQGEASATESDQRVVTARRSLTSKNNSVQISTPTYDYEYLCADLREKRMVPIIAAYARRASTSSRSRYGTPVRSSFSYSRERSKCTCSSTPPSCST